ncbi:hypothetical protein [Streptomyces sp. NPDC056948]|uniref:hypothetical protein n=1 Tax=Streptomyces sp. NPDC056948 TaxID=3345975 RepID=UPI003627049F
MSTPKSVFCAESKTWAWSAAKPGFEECKSWDLPHATARAYPHASADYKNRFSPAFLFDDQFDAYLPDRAHRVSEVARELIVTSVREGSRLRVLCLAEEGHPVAAPADRPYGAAGIGSSGIPLAAAAPRIRWSRHA